VTTNGDLIGEEPDIAGLTAELQAARVQNAKLLDAHRRDADALGRIAVAAGLADKSLDALVEGVTKQLKQPRALILIAPEAAAMPAPATTTDSDLTCQSCGASGAVDLGDGVALCDDCSGVNVLKMEPQ
jgi:hypothetical protein